MSSAPVNKSINIYINQASAEASAAQLQAKFDRISASIKKGEAAGKDMTKQIDELAKTKEKLQHLDDVMSGKIAPSIRMMRQQATALKRELEGMSKDDAGWAAKEREYKKVTASLKELESSLKAVNQVAAEGETRLGRTGRSIANIATGVLAGTTIRDAFNTAKAYVKDFISTNAEISDSMADIQKATGLTELQVRGLESRLANISTRTAPKELREIAIGLGQIGQAVTPEMVENVNRIVVALGDEFGGGAREITTNLGVLRNNLQDIKTNNYGQDILHIGNALNVLGAEGLATAPVVTDIANRIAGIGETFGMSAGQILGTAATFQELGIESERGSTAFIKLLQKMTQNVSEYAAIAKYAGISQKDFIKLVNEDAVAAFLKVAEGARIAGADNVTFGKILKDLDADGSGAGEMLSKLSTNSVMYAGKVKLASDALKSSSSITDEYNIKNNNLAATLGKIGNKMASWFTGGAIRKNLNDFATWFGQLIGAVDDTNTALDEFNRQSKKVKDLERDIVPLLGRIDELQSKSKLSKDEQNELSTAITGVANAIPFAITNVDQYGKALGISTEKARQFLDVQRAVLREKNRDAIKENQETIAQLEKDLSYNQNWLTNWMKRWDADVKKYGHGSDQFFEEGRAKIVDKINEIQDRLKGLRGINAELKGEPLVAGGTTTTDQPPGKPPGTGNYETDDEKKKRADLVARAKEMRRDIVAEFDALRKEAEALDADYNASLKSKDEQELQRIKEKYDKAIEKARDFAVKYKAVIQKGLVEAVSLAGLNEAQQQELNTVIKKQFDERSNREYQHSLDNLDNFYNQQRQKALQSYNDGKIDKQQYSNTMRKLDADEAEDRATIAKDYTETASKAAKDAEGLKTEALKKGITEREKLEAEEVNNKIYRAQRNVLTARHGSEGELNARLELIQAQFEAETAAMDRNTDAYRLKEAERDSAMLNAKQQYYRSLVDIARNALSQIQSATDMYFQGLQQQDDQALARDKAVNDEKKRNLDNRLKAGQISQSEYNRQVTAMDKQYDKQKRDADLKAFKRQQAYSIIKAIMDGAVGIAGIWAEYSANPILAAALTAISVAAVGLQVDTLSKQKPPSFGKGGQLPGITDGPSHSNGGIALINSNTGEKIGEVEGGEAVLSRETVKNNWHIIQPLLDSSLNRNGAPVRWLYSNPAAINTGAYQQSQLYSRMFASGGVVSTAGGSNSSYTPAAAPAPWISQEYIDTMNRLADTLSSGVEARLYWTDLKKQQEEYNQLKANSKLSS